MFPSHYCLFLRKYSYLFCPYKGLELKEGKFLVYKICVHRIFDHFYLKEASNDISASLHKRRFLHRIRALYNKTVLL